MVFSYNKSSNNTKFIPEYNAKNYVISEDNRAIIDDNLHILKILCPYLRDIYFKQGTVEPAVIIKDLIENIFTDNSPNIVISAAEYAFQLPSFVPCVVFHKKKVRVNGVFEDVSYSYNIATAIRWYLYEIRKLHTPFHLDDRMISTIMCMTGLPKRNISCLISANNTFRILKNISKEDWDKIENNIWS